MARQLAALVALFSLLAFANLEAEQADRKSDPSDSKSKPAQQDQEDKNREILAPKDPPRRQQLARDNPKNPKDDDKSKKGDSKDAQSKSMDDQSKSTDAPSKSADDPKKELIVGIPDELQTMLEKMDPEQRKRFWNNLQIWQSMEPEEKEHLRNRVQTLQEQVRKEASQALAKSGLKLDGDRREVFELRFFQERRKLERELSGKMKKERQDGMRSIIARLRKEFEPYENKAPGQNQSNQKKDDNSDKKDSRNDKKDQDREDAKSRKDKGKQGDKDTKDDKNVKKG